MNHWMHKHSTVYPIVLFWLNFKLKNVVSNAHCIFEDSSVFHQPLSHLFFFFWQKNNKLGKQKLFDKLYYLFLFNYEHSWKESQIPRGDKEELDKVHALKELILYLGRQDTFTNKKNK